jgi:TolA-binding protein
VYRASRRGSLLRFTIPTTIAIATAGVAIGVAVAYFSHGNRADQPQRTQAPRSSPGRAAASQTPPATASQSRVSRPAPKSSTPAAPAEGHRLNDQGYALLQNGDYGDAIAPLRRAVVALAGTGPADPYEAYANYNLGYALVQTGRCSEAVTPLKTANRLETNPAVDRMLRKAEACTPVGS